MTNIIKDAIKKAGGPKKVGDRCDRKPPSVHKWGTHGLPRTEYSGETNYAETLEAMTDGKYTKQQLLDASAKIRKARAA